MTRLALVVTIGVVLAACSGAGAPPSPDVAQPPPPSTTTSTSRPTTTTTTTTMPAEPLHVLLAGDSLMADTAPALLSALRTAEPAVESEFELAPSVPRTLSDLNRWLELVESRSPDVLVLFVGIWETASVNKQFGLGSPGWDATYRERVLVPWFDWLETNDIQTIWLRTPPIRSTLGDQRVRLVMDQIAQVAADHTDTVDFVNTADVLAPPYGAYRDGGDERQRRADGLHLCPAGARDVTELVLDRLQRFADVQVDRAWRDGDWQHFVTYDPAVECPPI